MNAKETLKICLEGLTDSQLSVLLGHVEKKSPILVGEEAGVNFTWGQMSDPIILACFSGRYPDRHATWENLHDSVQAVYDNVASRVQHSGYSVALQESTEDEVRRVIRKLAKERL